MLSACATGGGGSSFESSGMPRPEFLAKPDQPSGPRPIADPWEQQNREVFESNQAINHNVVYPIARAYNENVPESVRDRVDAFTTNLGEPIVFANNILQLRMEAAATTLLRFAMNSTVGVGGLFDVAASQNLPHQSGDLGQTLYVWGVRESPYLVLPIVGPTNLRDAIGSGIELAAQIPAGAIYPAGSASMIAGHVATAGTILGPVSDLRQVGDMEMLEESSLDFYSRLRTAAEQKRQAELQEAIETSALTAPPKPPDPNAIEPVMVLTASPAFVEKPMPMATSQPVRTGAPAVDAEPPPTTTVIGTPTMVIE
jgi:phospholipid-binding lipoprotein MlaA